MKILDIENFIKTNESYQINYNDTYTAIYVKSGYHESGWDFIGLDAESFDDCLFELNNSEIDVAGNGDIYIVKTNTIEILEKAYAKPIVWKADCIGQFKCEFISYGMGGSFSKKGIDNINNWKTNIGIIERRW